MQETCRVGSRLFAVVGPMGRPSDIPVGRAVVGVGGGLGVAPLYPHLRRWKADGAHVTAVVGFRSADAAFWLDRFAAAVDELVVCTDDGSLGLAGRVTDGLTAVLDRHASVDQVVAIGPPPMMRACAAATRPRAVPTLVSLNPIMVDGTGMCGSCRVTVGGEVRFACVDGPDFDGHQVDFDELIERLRRFHAEEAVALSRWSEHCRARRPEATP